MDPIAPLAGASRAAALGTAFVVSLAVVLFVERAARRLGLIDRPNSRSSHVVARPRGGGIGILCGMAAGLLVLGLAGERPAGPVWGVLVAALLVAAVGLCDNLFDLSVRSRLGAQALVACGLVWWLGGFDRVPLPSPADVPLGWLGPPLTVLWLVAVVNFFNFMDGADGLAGGQAVCSLVLAAWALEPLPAGSVAAVGAAATAAFLARNWAPAHIFLGDIGSSWLGFLLAALPLAAPAGVREDVVLAMAISLTLFLLDPIVTLVRRTARGAPIAQAHRGHAYQRLFDPRESHARVVGWLLGGALVETALAAAGYARPTLGWWVVIAAVAVFVVEWRTAARRSPG